MLSDSISELNSELEKSIENYSDDPEQIFGYNPEIFELLREKFKPIKLIGDLLDAGWADEDIIKEINKDFPS